ncbi:PRC-barrel domain-containing protein [Microvirga lotononidis]|uniref:PRC-barrel protein n=1 Tax=Microvirga lotononidis TaxID=864069 RepID=I4Z4R4_9HYPH|nr:PRC-barrel domain-containing protein [Microvirga lotononidis]EIM31206.1 PRC-barrel protein [Microvirga lotononidis]WQO29945.1 PRC-barrel domain-containing protein [Microvirga lotononidis]WQO30568.1 PRC-barrel domain-containing protein [Microvirga lotononidis]
MHISAPLLVATLCLTSLAHAQSTPPASGAPQFITIGSDAILSSRLIGLNVQTASGEGMGKIEDIVFEGGEIMGVVLSVGEILGGGPRYVAVDPSGISIRYVEGDHMWQATMNATLDQLKSAPEFRYEGKWKR